MGQAALAKVSVYEYLRDEEHSATRHEYVDGWVVAMAGASPEHNRISARLIIEIGGRLGKGGCDVFTSDQRVYVEDINTYLYPDMAVACAPQRFNDDNPRALLNPTLIVEVLSPSTAFYDQNDKLDYYKSCPSIQEVLFVHTRQRRMTVYRRNPPTWSHESLTKDEGALVLESLGIRLTLSEVYGDTFIPEQPFSIEE